MKRFSLFILFPIIFLFVDSFILDIRTISNNDEIRFIYISYLEYLDNFKGNSMTINKSKIDKIIDNVIFNKFNTIILHVSPFSDAIYNSEIFPYSYTLTGVEGKNPGFDYLEYFIKKAHSKKVSVHAWINPYRISSKNDLTMISSSNPALNFIEKEHARISDKGIYYNPTSEEVKNLIERQVLELIKNYEVDGIHFDDYFYVDEKIDITNYEKYKKNNGELSLSEFRLMHTNDLIKRISLLIKKANKNIIFSISPDGNINNNYKYHYADVKAWIKNGYVDIIMPQLYYGFNNQYLPFEKAYFNWYNLIEESSFDIKIIPVLAFYKVGMVDKNAGTGSKEWLSEQIICRQINYLKKSDYYHGFGLFRYDFLFNNNINNSISKKEVINIRNLCK